MIIRKMSLTSRGNLIDKLKDLLVGEGTEIKIAGRYYALRKSGITEGDSMEKSMLNGLKIYAINGCIGYTGFAFNMQVYGPEKTILNQSRLTKRI